MKAEPGQDGTGDAPGREACRDRAAEIHDGSVETVRIPDRELLKESEDAIPEETGTGCIHRLAKASDAILRATPEEDSAAAAETLAAVHKDGDRQLDKTFLLHKGDALDALYGKYKNVLKQF